MKQLSLAVLLAPLFVSTAHADIVVSLGVANFPSENITFGGGLANDANPIEGQGVNTGTIFQFFSDTLDNGSPIDLTAPAMGQARIEKLGGGDYSNLSFSRQDGQYFYGAEFNINASQDGFLLLSFAGLNVSPIATTVDKDSMTLTLDGGGVNRFNVYATAGQKLTSVSLTAINMDGIPVDIITDVRQIRVTTVPEPGSFTLLGMGGLSLLGYGWGRRRKLAFSV